MVAEGFKYKEFAEDLSGQAKAVVPTDISKEDQEYVYNTVHNFCFVAGEALANDTEHQYTVDQASIITQFIGEWSFHKSLDIIRGKIPPQHRDSIMQKIAFTIFEVAKQAVLRTHTTGISTKYLKENQEPMKMFSVGRVFRRETISYKHLPEFHQVEGIIAGENINFQNLLGVLKEFYKKLGFDKVRFRPAYFPYTYLSIETEVFFEEKIHGLNLEGQECSVQKY